MNLFVFLSLLSHFFFFFFSPAFRMVYNQTVSVYLCHCQAGQIDKIIREDYIDCVPAEVVDTEGKLWSFSVL